MVAVVGLEGKGCGGGDGGMGGGEMGWWCFEVGKSKDQWVADKKKKEAEMVC